MKKPVPLFKIFMPKNIDRAVLKTLHSGYIAEGKMVEKFTLAISKFLNNPFVVPVSSCTMALTIAYEVAGIKRGDEVISTPLTSIATNAPLLQLGAKIVWADCEQNTGMIDPKKLKYIITPKTKAIVVLHKDGDLARMDEIMAIAKKHKLKVIEDAAHTFGAKYRGRLVGSIGDFTCFSFQAIKHITTGDGGALVCKNESDYKKARKLKWLGVDKNEPHKNKNIWMDDVSIIGYKGNLNDISASIGLAQMKHVDKILKKHNHNGNMYSKLLKGKRGIILVDRDSKNFGTYWTYTLLLENREKVMSALETEGIASLIVHPRNDYYSIFKKSKRNLPGVDYYSEKEVSLPCGWWVTQSDIKRITDVIIKNAT